MITGMSDSKLPPFPFPRDSKVPLDTPPAYSEGPGPAPAPAPAPREPSNAPPVQPQATASNPFSQPTSSASMASRAAPQQFTHASPPAPPPATPVPPSPPGPHAYPRPADASSHQSSSSSETKTKTKTRGGSSPGATVARAVGQGVFALVAMPVVATAAALYGSGKLVEGIGRGLSAGPGAVLRAYRRMDGRIKGDASGGGTAAAQEERWHRYQQQHQQQQQQQQQRYPYEYGQGEGGVGWGGARGEGLEGVKPKLGERSLQMPMKGSLMEDPSVGMAGGSGSMRAKN